MNRREKIRIFLGGLTIGILFSKFGVYLIMFIVYLFEK